MRALRTCVWLGLCWGLCVPLWIPCDRKVLFRAWVCQRTGLPGRLPAGLARPGRPLRRAGLSRDRMPRDGRRSSSAPAWLVGFAPLVLFVPARSLPVFLMAIAAALIGYRWVAESRSRNPRQNVQLFETVIFVALFLAGMLVLFHVHVDPRCVPVLRLPGLRGAGRRPRPLRPDLHPQRRALLQSLSQGVGPVHRHRGAAGALLRRGARGGDGAARPGSPGSAQRVQPALRRSSSRWHRACSVWPDWC